MQKTPISTRMTVAFATGFGLGLSPVMSGTVGSLWGVVLVLAMAPLSVPWYALTAFLLVLLAVPVCDVAERYFQKKDDGRIVADEFMTFPICMIGLPVSLEFWWVLPMAFVTNRMFDIFKLPPARQFERMGGGAGVVFDDAAASAYSLILNHALFRLIVGLGIVEYLLG